MYCTSEKDWTFDLMKIFGDDYKNLSNSNIWKDKCVVLCSELNYHDQKIRWTLTHDKQKYWTALATLLGLHHWRSNQRPQIAEPKLYNWANSPYRTQATPNEPVMVIGTHPPKKKEKERKIYIEKCVFCKISERQW